MEIAGNNGSRLGNEVSSVETSGACARYVAIQFPQKWPGALRWETGGTRVQLRVRRATKVTVRIGAMNRYEFKKFRIE